MKVVYASCLGTLVEFDTIYDLPNLGKTKIKQSIVNRINTDFDLVVLIFFYNKEVPEELKQLQELKDRLIKEIQIKREITFVPYTYTQAYDLVSTISGIYNQVKPKYPNSIDFYLDSTKKNVITMSKVCVGLNTVFGTNSIHITKLID